MKRCSKCGVEKPVEAFSLRSRKGMQRRAACKQCSAAALQSWGAENPGLHSEITARWKKENPLKVKAASARDYGTRKSIIDAANARWRLAHPGAMTAYGTAWRKLNPERAAEHAANWARRNPAKVNTKTYKHRAAKLNATPAWANQFFIDEAYELAQLRTEQKTGGVAEWHVDHIVPLKSKLVCGLHVEHNLQVIPAVANIRKGNRFWPDMPA